MYHHLQHPRCAFPQHCVVAVRDTDRNRAPFCNEKISKRKRLKHIQMDNVIILLAHQLHEKPVILYNASLRAGQFPECDSRRLEFIRKNAFLQHIRNDIHIKLR